MPHGPKEILASIIGPLPEYRPKHDNQSVPLTYIERLLEKYDGFKMLYYELNPVFVDYFKSRSDIKIVHLVRQDSLECCISKIMASTTKIYHVPVGREHKCCPITVCVKDLERRMMKHKRDVNKHNNMFGNPYCVFYEDLVSSWDHTIGGLLDFMGAAREPLPMKLQKVVQDPIHKVVKNYQEIKAHFQGTEFEKFFKSPILHL